MHPRILATVLSIGLACSLAGRAQAQRGEPSSLLLFPVYDSRPGTATFLTVTNSNVDVATGSTLTHWVYHDAANCLLFDRLELLTPGDTLTVLASAHNPVSERGFLSVAARDVATNAGLPFEWLLGTATVLDGVGALAYTAEPATFAAVGGDLDGDHEYALDGVEYASAPRSIAFSRFFGQEPGIFDSELVVLDLTSGFGFTTIVDLLMFNDNEEVFSAQHAFTCWAATPLSSISGVFDRDFLATQTNHDPNEIFGLPQQESGWFSVRGLIASSSSTTLFSPGILGLLVDRGQIVSAGARPLLQPEPGRGLRLRLRQEPGDRPGDRLRPPARIDDRDRGRRPGRRLVRAVRLPLAVPAGAADRRRRRREA